MQTIDLEQSPNSFVREFFPIGADGIQKLVEIETEIADEKEEWKNSAAAAQIMAGFDEILKRAKGISFGNRPLVIQDEEGFLYEDTTTRTRPSMVDLSNRLLRQQSKSTQEAFENQERIELAHKSAYQTAIKSLVTDKTATEDQLRDQVVTVAGSSLNHLREFSQFLTEEAFADLREESRPLLKSLHIHSRELTQATLNSILENSTNPPEVRAFGSFIEDLLNKESHGKDIHWQKWLGLVCHPLGINSPLILEKLVESGQYPPDLKRKYEDFLRSSIIDQNSQITKALGIINPTEGTKLNLYFESSSRKHNHFESTAIARKPNEIKSEPKPKQTYQLALASSLRIPCQEEFDEFIEEQARKIANYDSRTSQDIKTILESLTKDPYGLGVEKLGREFRFASPFNFSRSISRWHFCPNARPDLVLENPTESDRLRPIYFYDKKAKPGSIFIERVIHHNRFDKLYTS